MRKVELDTLFQISRTFFNVVSNAYVSFTKCSEHHVPKLQSSYSCIDQKQSINIGSTFCLDLSNRRKGDKRSGSTSALGSGSDHTEDQNRREGTFRSMTMLLVSL